MKRTSFLVRTFALVILPAIAGAQDEAALKRAFEGKRVTVKIEMPATKWGIDIRIGSDAPIDYKVYSQRIKEHGVALRPGDSVLITGVKVKEDHIEFQLAGGGYGTMFDESDAGTFTAPSSKSQREKNLEKDIKNEKDPRKRARMREELDDLRRDRQRDDRLTEAAEAEANESRRGRIRQKALDAGSRFNLRYPKGQLRQAIPIPETIAAELSEWLFFGDTRLTASPSRKVCQALPPA